MAGRRQGARRRQSAGNHGRIQLSQKQIEEDPPDYSAVVSASYAAEGGEIVVDRSEA